MQISVLDTPGLGDRSYVVSCGDVAVVVDPQRDIDRVIGITDSLGARVTHVLETHLHNDYVTGGLELSRVTGAEYVVPGGVGVGYPRRAVADGDVIDAGPFTLTAVHTPGHTHHHMSYTLRDDAGRAVGVFTGGSMLHGTTGRTDLVGEEHTDALTRAQYRSVRRLAWALPPQTRVYPTHGFGSFCAATPSTGDSSTIGDERAMNPALTRSEQAYIEELIAGLSAYPAYYAQMGPINRAGPPPVSLAAPRPVDGVELRRRIDAGEWVVDLRQRTAFAAGHLAGSLGFELSGSFVTYLGWLHRWGAPLTLLGNSPRQIADARRELVRIGVDDVAGAAVGEPGALGAGELRSYRVAAFTDLAGDGPPRDDRVVLDVRQPREYQDSHLAGARNIALQQLPGRIGEIPAGTVWVHCGTGYRASIAAALLDAAGRLVVLVDDDFENARKLHLAP